jgi:hypothetical protein
VSARQLRNIPAFVAAVTTSKKVDLKAALGTTKTVHAFTAMPFTSSMSKGYRATTTLRKKGSQYYTDSYKKIPSFLQQFFNLKAELDIPKTYMERVEELLRPSRRAGERGTWTTKREYCQKQVTAMLVQCVVCGTVRALRGTLYCAPHVTNGVMLSARDMPRMAWILSQWKCTSVPNVWSSVYTD